MFIGTQHSMRMQYIASVSLCTLYHYYMTYSIPASCSLQLSLTFAAIRLTEFKAFARRVHTADFLYNCKNSRKHALVHACIG